MKNGSELEKNLSTTLIKNDLMPLVEANLRTTEPKKGFPGFRPGNAPLQVLYEKDGQRAVQESVRTLISQRAEEWTEGRDLFQPLSFTVDWDKLPKRIDHLQDIDVQVHVAFMPTIEDIDWQSIKVPSYDVEIKKEDIQKELKNRAEKSFRPVPLQKERPAQKGDFLFYTTKHKTKDSQETVSKKSLRLGGYTLPKEFEDSLIGIVKGHEIKEKVQIPKNYPDKNLAGTKAHITIIFHDIQDSVPCNPDEDFAKMSGFQSLQDMEKSVQKELEDHAKILLEISERRSLKKILSGALSFDPASSSIEKIESLLKHSTSEDKKIDDKDLHQKALDQARIDCVIKKMVKDHDITVQDAELMAYARQIAQQSGQSMDAVVHFWRSRPGYVDAIVQDILERKCMDVALSLCQTEKEPLSFDKIIVLVEGGNAQ